MKIISIIAVFVLILMAGAGSASSGDGTITVNPTSFTAGSIDNNLTFTFNNQAHTFSSGSQATITIPSLWTAPQKSNSGGNGYVSVTANGATSISYSISGQTITVNFKTNNEKNKGFTITYNKVNAPETSGIYTFTTKTKDGNSGSLRNINTQPAVKVNPASASTIVVSGFHSPTIAGDIGSFTVTAKDAYGNTATGYTGKVHFTSSDGQAVLPPDTLFVASDKGIHTFSARLKTAGTQWLKATDNANSGITGSQTIIVKPDHADKLVFASQPSNTVPGGIISPPVKVQIWDQYNNLVMSSTAWVTVAIGSSHGSGTLSGTESRKAINGVATFDDLSIDKAGTGYTLKASSRELSSATSIKFDIKLNPPTYTHTITPSPMVGDIVKDIVTSTSTSGNKMEFKWIRPNGHTASTDYVPRSHNIYVDSYRPNVAGLWTINVKEFDSHHVTLGESSTSFNVTENPEFGKLGAVLPLFAVGLIYMNFRKKFNK